MSDRSPDPETPSATVARGRTRRDPVRTAPAGREMADRVEPDPGRHPPGRSLLGQRDLLSRSTNRDQRRTEHRGFPAQGIRDPIIDPDEML